MTLRLVLENINLIKVNNLNGIETVKQENIKNSKIEKTVLQ